MKKRFVALLLCLVMVLSMLPGTVWAAVADLLQNTPAENQALLEELAALTGGTTEEAYAMLEQLGLLDEDGRLKTNYTLSLNGKEYTLDEIEALLEDPDTDLSQVGYVDGMAIALGDLKTILEIERELQRIQETYFSGETFSGESLQYLNGLLDQIQTQGLDVQSGAATRAGDGMPVYFLNNKVVDVSNLQEIPLEIGYNYGYSGYFYINHNAQSGETVSFDLTLDPGSLGTFLKRVDVSVNVPTAGNITVTLTPESPTATWSCTLPTTESGGSNNVRIQVCAVTDSYGATETGFYGNLAGALHFSNPTGGLVFRNGSDYTDNHTVMLTTAVNEPGSILDTEATVSDEMTIVNGEAIWSQARFRFLDSDGTRVRQIDSLRQLLQNSLQDASGNPVTVNEANAVKFQVSGQLVQTNDIGIVFSYVPFYLGTPNKDKDRWYLPVNSSDLSKDYTVRLINGEMVLEWETYPGNFDMENNTPVEFLFQGWSLNSEAIPEGLFFDSPFSTGGSYPSSGTATVQDCRVELLNDNTLPELYSATAPEGTYYPGQRVPVTLRFSELVKVADGTIITVNGEKFTAEELYMNTVGNDLVLWYPVQSVDGTSLSVSFGDASGSGVTDFYGNPAEITGKAVDGAAIESIRMRSGVIGLSATCEDGQIVFSLDADRSEKYMTLYTNYDNSGSGEAPFRVQLYESGSYGTYGTPKETIQVYMPASDSDPFSIASYPVELQETDQVYYAYVQVNEGSRDNPQWVDAVWSYRQINVGRKVLVKNIDVTPESDPDNYNLYLNKSYRPTLTATLTGSGGSTPTYVSGKWYSTDEAIATVTTNPDYTGTVTLTGNKVGPVQFYFQADNGTPGDSSDDAKGYSGTYTVTAGNSLALVIPSNASTIIIRQDEPATVLWSSNAKLMAPDAKFEYTIEVFKGDFENEEQLENEQWVRRMTASQDSNSAEIDYGFNDLSDGDTPTYTVRVSMPHPEGESEDVRLSALAWIIVRPRPVQAEILTPKNDMILDETDGSVNQLEVPFSLTNFYPKRQTATLELIRIEEDGTVTPGQSQEIILGGEGADESTMITVPNGSKWFDIEPVKNGHLRDIYQAVLTVTDQTGVYDRETAVTDSIYLYVYNADAFYLVDGEGNNISSNNLVVSNEEMAEDLPTDTDAILALREQLRLQEEVSINYEGYDWDSIRDTIQWDEWNMYTDQPGIDLNYKQGGLYEDIENFSYTEYLPETVMLVTPDGDVESAGAYYGWVNAIHSATGNRTSARVYIYSLKDKLFLFQVSPRVKTAVDTGMIQTETNEDGVLALYSPYGIFEDVSFRSEYNGEVYLGTIPVESLRSGEGDATRLELYPINTIILRPAGKVELTLIKPDGSPLAGASVTIRGGVYKNGGYCENAIMGPNAESLDAGSVGQTYTTDETGKLTIYYDSTLFWSSENGETPKDQPTSLDQLEYVLEISGIDGDRYYPLFRTVNGSMSLDQCMRTSEDVILLEEVPDGEAREPFVAEQTVAYAMTPGTDPDTAKTDVRKATGMVGPNSTFQEATLFTTMYLWGESMEGAENYVLQMASDMGYVPDGQTWSVTQYPFSSIPVAKNTMTLNEENMTTSGWIPDGEDAGLKTRLSMGDTLLHERVMPFRVIDLTRVPKVNETKEVTDVLVTMEDSSGLLDVSFGEVSGDNIIQLLTGNLDDLSGPVDSSVFKMIITPSADPTVFNALIWTGYDTLGLDEGDYSDAGVALSTEFLSQDMGVGVPGTGHLMEMAKGTYNPAQTARDNRAQGNFGDLDINLQLEGWYEAQIRYNRETKKWEAFTLGGGFTAGAGVGYTFNINAFVGPVPVTASFGVGGSIQLDFQAAARYSQQKDTHGNTLTWADSTASGVNDYLTNLRLNAYASAFGGVGFDLSIVALKFGVFGELSLDSQNRFLSRTYLLDKDQQQLDGQRLEISGQAGIKFVAKLVLLEYEAVLVSGGGSISKNFSDWGEIKGYWDSATSDPSLQSVDSGLYLASATAKLQSRDYLEAYARTWGQPQARMALYSLDPVNGLASLETNANPASYPDVTEDGQILVYVHDGYSTGNPEPSIYDSRTHFSTFNGSGYTMSQAIPNPTGFPGCGDSNAVVSGSTDFAAAAWVRMNTKLPGKDKGATVSKAEQTLLLNGTEIVVSIYEEGVWTSTRLTENGSPDLAPVVATDGNGNAVVFWRSVYTSTLEDTLNFGAQDYIMFSRYDRETKDWSEPELLYNGTTGTVMGLQAAMLPDGTAMVVYTMDRSGSGDTTQYEVGYCLVDSTGTAGLPMNATRDTNLDENPQVVAADFGSGDYRFVLAWHSVQEGTGNIRLMAINKDGVPSGNFPGSLISMVRSGAISVGGDFRLTSLNRANQSLDDLTVVWSETVSDEKTGMVDHTILKAATFCSDGDGGYCLSAPQELAELGSRTLADHFDVYVSGQNQIKAVIQATKYHDDQPVEDEDTGISVPGEEALLYTATATFDARSAEVEELYVDYGELAPELSVPIQFTVRNTGLTSLEDLTVTLSSGESATHTGTLLPNESVTLTVYHQVGETVQNLNYTVKDAGGVLRNGAVYLDYPDIGISRLEVLEESAGQRTIAVTFYNASGAPLTGKDREVKLALYLDELYTQPANVSCAAQTGVQCTGNTLTISGDEALRRVDEGSMMLILTYNLGNHVQNTLGLQEIPDSGVMLYADAWAEGRVGSQTEIVRLPEYIESNNQASVRMDGALSRTGEQFTLNVEQGADTDGNTTADVILKNNGLQSVATTPLLAVLLDGEDNLVEAKQVEFDGSPLDGESERTAPVAFSESGSRVVVYPTNSQDTLIFDGLNIRMSDFTYDEEQDAYCHTVTGITRRGILVTAYAADGTVTINQAPLGSGGSQWVQFRSMTDTITVTLGQKTYVLTVNLDPSLATDAMFPNILKDPESATYELNEKAKALEVEAESPDGGILSFQWCISQQPYEYVAPMVTVAALNAPAFGAATTQFRDDDDWFLDDPTFEDFSQSLGGITPIPGANESTYIPPTNQAGLTHYLCIVTNTNLGAMGETKAWIPSYSATIDVLDPSGVPAQTPDITVDPQDANYIVGEPAEELTVKASVTDGGTLSYQWYGEIPGVTEGAVMIPGAIESSYDPTMPEAVTAYYYCVVTNTNINATGAKTATATSGTAIVVYEDASSPTDAQTPVIDVQPANANYAVGELAELTVKARVTDGGALSYQWYRSEDGSTTGGTEIPSATDARYAPPTDQAGTAYYYCVVTNTNDAATGDQTAEITTRAAKITVTEGAALVDAQTPTIDVQPANANYAVGELAELTVKASVTDGGALSYQWYRSEDGSTTGGTEIPSATDASYTPPTDQAGTVYYYCVVTNTCDAATGDQTAEITTRAAKITVTAPAQTEFTILFDANGGNVEPASATTSGGKLGTLPQPTRSDYTFDGWFTDREGGTQVTGDTVFQEETTIYAHWTYAGGTQSGGSVGTPTYRITVEPSANGAVKASRATAGGGSRITLTVTPDDGYHLRTLTVTSGSGKEIELEDEGNGVYTFTMPYSAVTIRAGFSVYSNASQCLRGTDCPAYGFTDLDLHAWYHDGVHYSVEQGLMNGTGDHTFSPNGTTTRGMIVTILYRMEGETAVTGTGGFADVPEGQWYTDAVIWAAANDIVTGYGDGRFGPDDPITREQMSAILFRYAQYKAYDVSVGEDTNILSYVDVHEVSEYAIPAMQWACGTGLVNGVTETTLNPKGTATRAQVATLLMRFEEKAVK